MIRAAILAALLLGSLPAPGARAEEALGDRLGVNTHIGFAGLGYDDAARTQRALVTADIHLIRVSAAAATFDPAQLRTLAAAGIRFDMLIAREQDLPTQIRALGPFAASIDSIEGPNEANTWPMTWQGRTDLPAQAAFQRALYAAVRADPALSRLPVFGLTLGGVGEAAYRPLGDLSAASDFGNSHVYFPPGRTLQETASGAVPMHRAITPGRPFVVSETGFPTVFDGKGGVSESAAASLGVAAFLDLVQAGARRVYVYELFDQRPDPGGTDRELHFGLFRTDATPKPLALALRRLIQAVGDAVPVPDGGVAVGPLPAAGGHMVARHPDGRLTLLLWTERPALSLQPSPRPLDPAPVAITGAAIGKVTDLVTGLEMPDASLGDHPLAVALTR